MKLGLRSTPRARSIAPGRDPRLAAERGATPRQADDAYDFSPGEKLRITRHVIGQEANPILIVDGLLRNPSSAVDFAEAEVRYVPGPETTYYPGTRGRNSPAYIATFLTQLEAAMRDCFALPRNVRLDVDNMFSMTTTRPSDLRPLQKVPHVDVVNPRGLAVVHYLFDKPMGGTGFFRHRATGWESLTEERHERFQRLVGIELEASLPPGYLFDSNLHFERTFNVEPAMDRLVIFFGHLLHSATIPPAVELPDSPREGRLTVNSFIAFS